MVHGFPLFAFYARMGTPGPKCNDRDSASFEGDQEALEKIKN